MILNPKEEDLLLSLRDILNRIDITNKCRHQKVYAPYELESMPAKRPWICSLCGEEGSDFGIKNIPIYDDIKRKFNKN